MIESGVPVSAKKEFFQGIHDFNNDTFKIALYTSAADLSLAGTTAYTATGEVAGPGYSPGGLILSGGAVATDNGVAVVDFNDITFTGTTLSYQGALLYNSSKSNRAVLLVDFGPSDGAETDPKITFPAPSAVTAVIRM